MPSFCKNDFFSLQKGRCTSSICLKHLSKVLDQLLKNCRRSWLYKPFLSATDRQSDRGNNIIRHGGHTNAMYNTDCLAVKLFHSSTENQKGKLFLWRDLSFFSKYLVPSSCQIYDTKCSSTSVLSLFQKIDIISFIKI